MRGSAPSILPAAVVIAPALVPVAATGLAVVMVGAAVTHGRRGETKSVAVSAVLLALALVVAPHLSLRTCQAVGAGVP